MKNTITCSNCPYFYCDEYAGEEKATCHYHWDDGYAPCEVEDEEEDEEEDEADEM